MSNENDLSSRFAHFHATTEPYMTGRGGPEVRAAVARRRRRAATTVAVAIVLVVVAGVAALATQLRPGPDRLVPATPAPAPSSLEPTMYEPPPALADASLDLRRISPTMCGGQIVKLKDNFVSLWRTAGDGNPATIYSFSLEAGPIQIADINGDGIRDQALVVGCVPEGGGSSHNWLMYFTGQGPNLSAQVVLPSDLDDLTFASKNNSGPVIESFLHSGGKMHKWNYDVRTGKLTEVPG